jgi:ATP-dependent RNA helicase RhlE
LTSFTALELLEPIKRAVSAQGYTTPTPIQAEAIPHLLQGRDLLGCAQTGTGKTAAFTLPILDRLARAPQSAGPRRCRALILTPTRELAAQIGESIRDYGQFLKLHHAVVFGGVGQGPQVRALTRGIDILVATPGRLLDLMGQGHLRLDRLEVFVLDEADRMLDMGFIHDVRRVIRALPARRQTLLFSATMPDEIANLAAGILSDPLRVEVAPVSSTADRIEQTVMHVARADKPRLLANLLREREIGRVLVFSRTKHGADRIAKQLGRAGVAADSIHGDKAQNARTRTLGRFRNGTLRVLIATDIAARGIDVEGISHVINYDLPNVPESYVHRIGRTARAGKDGIAIAFCDPDELPLLKDIEKLTRSRVPVDVGHPWHVAPVEPVRAAAQKSGRRRRRPAAAPRRAA